MLRSIVSVTFLALFLVGCGGGSGDSGTPPPAITITSSAPPAATVGSLYLLGGCGYGSRGCKPQNGFVLSASGGVGTITWTWAAAAGSSLPPGLSLAGDRIGGTPPVGSVGSYSVIVTASNSGINAAHELELYLQH